MVIPQHLFTAVKKIQDTILISPPVISQHAAIGALAAAPVFLREKREVMANKRKNVLDQLANLSCLKNKPISEGAFYVLLNIDSDMSDIQLVKHLIENHGVATIPGSAFGINSGCYIRLSYGALSDSEIQIGLDRLKDGLSF